MNGNTDQRGLRVVKASCPRVCVCMQKKRPNGMCMVCVNAPRAHISAQSSFMPVRVERRRRMREGCFVQRRSGVT